MSNPFKGLFSRTGYRQANTFGLSKHTLATRNIFNSANYVLILYMQAEAASSPSHQRPSNEVKNLSSRTKSMIVIVILE